METCPLDNTMALGPVPEGSINAQEAAIVAGIINKKGLIFVIDLCVYSNMHPIVGYTKPIL